MTAEAAAFLVPLALRFEDGAQQFVVLQQGVHFSHPGLP
jgi:hypothetical protein